MTEYLQVGTAKKDFEKISPYKDTIEKIMYKKAGMVSEVQIVAGPDIGRHVRNARDLVATSEIATVEILDNDWHVHEKQADWLAGDNSNIKGSPSWQAVIPGNNGGWYREGPIMHIKHGVTVTEMDLFDITKPKRFIDADLMGAITGHTGEAIDRALQVQSDFYPQALTHELKKAMIFTFAMRPVGEEDTLDWIKNLIKRRLDTEVIFSKKTSMITTPNARIQTNGFKGPGVHSYEVKPGMNGRLVDMCLFYYNEIGCPMITGMVVYR